MKEAMTCGSKQASKSYSTRTGRGMSKEWEAAGRSVKTNAAHFYRLTPASSAEIALFSISAFQLSAFQAVSAWHEPPPAPPKFQIGLHVKEDAAPYRPKRRLAQSP